MTEGFSITICGVSMVPSSGRAELPPGRKKKASSPRGLGGRKEAQLQEPSDHALGRSRGGFGTKVHLVCDSHGSIVALFVTAGQRHESKFFERTMAQRLFHRGQGQNRWPLLLAADKGYSYPRIRRWCRRRQVAAVIPTRKDQPREENFDKETYKQRNIVERVVGWYKEYRGLGTRHEKLAVNYVALWLVAIMDRSLKRLYPS
jgi:transposase